MRGIHRRRCALTTLTLVCFSAAIGLTRATSVTTTAAHQEDWAKTIEQVYAVISGPVGEARDWDQFRNLFIDDARLIVSAPRGPEGSAVVMMTPEDYIDRSGQTLVDIGFTESEIARRAEQYGNIVHVFSTYEGTFTRQDGQAGSVRGINSIQLIRTTEGWKVATILWQSESDQTPLPPRYLKSPKPEPVQDSD